MPIEVLAASELNQTIQYHDPLSAKAGDLGFQTVQGMLKGFIDLVFEHQGKYYVLDWKSNHLGDDVAVYHGEALKSAMADHRYDLQYQIYALALHRFYAAALLTTVMNNTLVGFITCSYEEWTANLNKAFSRRNQHWLYLMKWIN